jgi:hypothetical protein
MKNLMKGESYNPLELETRLQSAEIEELEARLEMSLPSSWCTSSCGTQAPGPVPVPTTK